MTKKVKEKETPAPQLSYFQWRLNTYGFDTHNDTTLFNKKFDGFDDAKNKPKFKTEEKPAQWFSEDNQGNIKILYKSLYNLKKYYHDTSGKAHEFFRLCLSPANRDLKQAINGKAQKYTQPEKSGVQVFLTQHVIDSFCFGQEIETLYLIEGEFKAFSLWQQSVLADAPKAVVGLPGIHMYTDESKKTPCFNETIDEIIKACKVKKIVVIHDADCLEMGSWNPEKEPNKDLSKRLRSFYGVVANIREIVNNVYEEQGLEFYYMHIKADYLTEECHTVGGFCKGLDDLFLARKGKEIDILEDLEKKSKAKLYFDGFNASEKKPDFIQDYFLLKKKGKVPSKFYGKFEKVIQNNVFNFQGWRYQYLYNETEQTWSLQTVQHSESHKYIRVGIKYLKILYKPNSKGVEERKLEPWSKDILKQDFVDKGYLRFFDEIKKYSDFCNVPEHDPDKYKLEFNNAHGDTFFNLYYPITHPIQNGNWETIKNYLTHIFSKEFLPFALDYLYLSYTNPNQRVPIICLVSKEHNTGKSTFLWFLRELFMENTTIIGNQELHDNFNDDYVTKKFICIDEGLIEKVAILEKIKSWNTSHKIKMNTKNVSRTEIDFFANIVMTSNHEDNFARIDPNADRFAVFKVPQLKKRDPDLLEKMSAEIPHLLYYLKNEHKMSHDKKERFWFSVEDYATDALRAVQKESKSWLHKTLDIMIETLFIQANSSTKKVYILHLTETEIFKELQDKYKKSPEIGYLRKVLKDEMKLNQHHCQPKGWRISDNNGEIEVFDYTKPKGRYYILEIQNFLKDDQMKDLNISATDIEIFRSQSPF